jgi:uncharacterized protein (DUF1015 family)
MATIYPFQPYRYAPAAGPLGDLVTQPYDKIYPDMRARYLAASPYNLVRIILGEKFETDTNTGNVYTRAAAHLQDWIAKGVLARDAEPSFYPYFQEFTDPDTGERLTRKGFIGLGKVEEYSAGVVHRHEQTLSGPKKDRLELLRHAKGHFGQIFMLYPDAQGAVDTLLDEAAGSAPLGEVTDEYGAVHRIWRLSNPAKVAEITQRMSDKKLVIADGHHRYETALAYSKENPTEAAQRVMMTFVNMHAPGLRILATHRLVNALDEFAPAALLERLRAAGRVETFASAESFKARFAGAPPESIRVGVAIAGDSRVHVLEAPREKGVLDVPFLHERILSGMLGIGEEAVREERYIRYVRGIDAALGSVHKGEAQLAFLLQPTTIDQVASVSFGGGVMPQKSTDFYPKLLSGMTIYRLE